MADPTRTVAPPDGPAVTASVADPAATTAPPSSVGVPVPSPSGTRYVLGDEIARGGMGEVYRATDTVLGREVAVKVLQDKYGPASAAARRFADEARITGQLQHPAIPPVHDLGTLPDGRPFLAMKLIKGDTLDQLLKDRADLSADRGRFIAAFELVCQAVAYAHAHNVLHRDLKPANVMVGAFGEVQVMDWGLAKVLRAGSVSDGATSDPEATTAPTEVVSLRDSDGSVTQAGSILGTPAFMPPEQAAGAVGTIDARSDVFGLGAILSVILTGQPPFVATSAETTRVKAAQGDVAECFAKLDECGAEPELVALCKRCLSPKQADRPADAGEVAAAVATLRAAADEQARRAELDGVKAAEKRKRRRTQFVLAAVAVGLLTAVAVGSVLASLWRDAEQAKGEAVAAQRDAEAARAEAEAARERLAAVEYGRTMQVAYREWLDNNAGATVALLASTRPDLRGWEYHYLHGLCNTHLLTLKGHTKAVGSAAFSPDGTRIVTNGYDGTVRVWDAKTGAELLTLEGNCAYYAGSALFSSDGTRILNTGQGLVARIWDVKTGAKLLERKIQEGKDDDDPTAGYLNWFNPDGTRILSFSNDGKFRLWDAQSGAALFTFRIPKRLAVDKDDFYAISAAFSPDCTRIVSGSFHPTAWVWDANTGVEEFALKGHTSAVFSVSFSADGTRIATGSRDRSARIWDAKTGATLVTIEGHSRAVTSVCFSRDGSRILTASDDRTVRVWDAGTGTEVMALKGHAGVYSAAFSPDGSRIVSAGADGTVRVWDSRTSGDPPLLKGHTNEVLGASFNQDRTRVLSASGDGTVRVWDTRTGTQLLVWPFDKDRGWVNNYRVAVCRDGTRVATSNEEGRVQVWDAKTGAELLVLKGLPVGVRNSVAVNAMAFSPDGLRIATVSLAKPDPKDMVLNSKVQVWDARNGNELLSHKSLSHKSTHIFSSISFSPDGAQLMTIDDQKAFVWDVKTGDELLAIQLPDEMASDGTFSPDGSKIVTGGFDGTVRVWDAKTGAEVLILRGHAGYVISVSYSPDGSRIITGGEDGTVRLWDARTGVEVLTLKGHKGSVRSAAFSPDGEWIVSGGSDGAVRLWGVRSVAASPAPPAK